MASRPQSRPRASTRAIPHGPFKGVRDVGDAGEQDPRYAQDAINCHFADSARGGAVFARTGFRRATSSALAANAVNGVFGMWHAASGSFLVFAVCDQKVFRRSGATSWTDVTPVGVSIAGGGGIHVQIIEYNGEIIVNDTFNKPWRGTSLTSTPIIGTEIDVNTAASTWVARGKPTVYGGKLFFVVDSIAGTTYASRMVWSEEASASTGYLQSGYTNSWDLIQTGSEQLNAIVGTNVALYYFRRSSIGAITGAVNATFTTTSTHDAISPTVGVAESSSTIVGECAVLLANGYVWFVSNDGLPCRFRVGSSQIEPLWHNLRRRIRLIQQTAAHIYGFNSARSLAYISDVNKVVMLFLPDSTAALDYSRNLYVFDADTGNYEGRWLIELASQPASEESTAVTARVLAVVPRDDSEGHPGSPALLVGGRRPGTSTEGHLWMQYPRATQTFGDNSAAMHQSITTMLGPDEQNVEFHVDEVSIECVPDTTAVSLDYYTPYGSSTGLAMAGTASADSIQSSYDHGIQRIGLGNNAFGRWFRAVFHKNVASGSTQHAFEQASLLTRGYPARTTSP